MADLKTKKPYRVPAIRDLREDTPAGHCVFCQEPFVNDRQTGRGDLPQQVCGKAERSRDAARDIENECERSYQRLRMAQVRKEEAELAAANRTDTAAAFRLLERAMELLTRVQQRSAPIQESRR